MSSRYNWDNASHERLYNDIHGIAGFWGQNGAGVSGAAGAQDGWAALAELMARAREGTEAALAEAGAVWEGAAGYAMRSGVTPLARWADDAHTASAATQGSTDTHVEAYSSAKNHMPEPVPVTSTANSDMGGIPATFIHLLGGQTDQDRQEAAAQEAKAEAVRIMTGYESRSGFAQIAAGRFVPPPSVTVDVPPSTSRDGDGIPVGDGAKPGTGPVQGDSTPSARDDTPGGGRGPGATTPPSGNGSSTPPPGGTPTPQGATTPSFTATTPPASPPPVNPVTTGAGPDPYRPGSTFVPTLGGPTERGAGGGRGPYGRGFGGGFGEGGGTGRTPGGPGAGGGSRGVGGPVSEPVAGRTGAAGTSGARGAGGMGVAPAGRRSEGDEDKVHAAAEYLRDFHDDFWDDTPPVAPAVIGEDED